MWRRLRRRFWAEEDGAVLVETLIAMPVLTLLTFGILEFGNLMWQRQQLQIGVRDAARYWSKCRSSATFDTCDIDIARNIAFFGHPDGSGSLRVPEWDDPSELTILPSEDDLWTSPDLDNFVVVEGRVAYQGSPVFNAVFSDSIEIGYWATMRHYGW